MTEPAQGTIPQEGVIGVDIGGTSVKGGLLLSDGTRRLATPLPTDLGSGATPFLDALARWIRALGPDSPVGVGVPGVFEPGTRKLAESPNLKCLSGLDLGEELGRRLGRPAQNIPVENDANLAALGEQWLGAGRGQSDLVMVTLGTGVGGGILLHGRIFRGSLGRGGEIGHLNIHGEGQGAEPCGCGKFGCLESYASASAAQRRARQRGLPADLGALSDAARRGPGPERDLLHEIGVDLGHGLAQILVLLDVPTFVIGGGFGAALDLLREGILEGIRGRDFAERAPRIVPAELGSDAGWLGAARLALDHAEQNPNR
ncbi:MAG: ROK family protein [Planctomycetes bacterium]|nr:ROK family protein [Planctomycetota bacterium]